MYSYFLILGNL